MTFERFEELAKRYGLHRKAKVTDLPAEVLAAELTADELAVWCACCFFGNHFDALQKVDKERFKAVNHGQWDLTLSAMAGIRVCGLQTDKGECPYPFENDLEWWLSVRTDLKLKEGKV